MSAAEESFHHGEVRYEEAVRKLIEAANLFKHAAGHFADAGVSGALGRRRAVDAYEREDAVRNTLSSAQRIARESQGWHEETG